MKPTTELDGNQIAKSIYGNKRADTFQVRNTTTGHKLAEFDHPGETRNFLRDRNRKGIEVWLLKGMPGELIEITTANNFMNRF